MRSLLLVFLATACSEGRVLQTPPDGSVECGYTWWADVQPIIETKCQLCHGNPTRFENFLVDVQTGDVSKP